MVVVRLLGPVEVIDDTGTAHPVGSALRRTLLALLALRAGQMVRADWLLEHAWEGEPPESGLRALRFHISRLRYELGEDGVIETRPGGYRLAVSADQVDALAVAGMADAARCEVDPHLAAEVYADALAMWRGEPFADVAPCPLLDDEAGRLDALRLIITEDLFQARLDAGGGRELVADLSRATAQHPLRESLWSMLITAQYRAGLQADALRSYEQMRTMLSDDLGLDPSSELQDLQRRVLQHDPSLGGAPGAVVRYRMKLPRIQTPFIGGEVLLGEIAEQLRVGSVVTLTGTGGVGKTRAAIEFGHHHLADFDQGVFFVELAPVSGTGAVIGAVASALPIVPGGEQSLLETLLDWIGERCVLLVIDNCEHLVAEVADLVEKLIARCSNLKILATSREALGVHSERVHRVPSLDADGAAVELFCERARATDATFIPEGHRDVLVQICARLDGIPLAIELAAARIRSLSAEELLERLRDRFRLLRGSGRGTLDRHQTLRATVSWSYRLLTEDERRFFDRSSVFAGGFDLRAAETVCGFDPIDTVDVIDLVSSLVDKSMIVADRGAVRMRYRLLETLRQYGEDQMELRGETALLRDRHAAYYADLTAELDQLSRGARQIEGEARMSIEWDNLRAAHLWSFAQGELDLAERLAEGSFQYSAFSMRHEHAAMLARTVELGDERDRPSTNMLGMLAYWMDVQGNGEEARRVAQRGLDAAPAPDHPATANCWWTFASASAAVSAGSSEALAAFEHQAAAVANTPDLDLNWWALACLIDASLNADRSAIPALRRQVSDMAARVQSPRLTISAHQYEGHGWLTASPPDFAAAITSFGHVAEIARATGDRQSLALALRCLAMASTGLDAPDALARCQDALDTLFEIRHWQKILQTLESVTLALARAGRTEHAALILGHLDAHSPGFGLEHGLHFRDQARQLIEDDGAHNAAKLDGAQMPADELVATASAYCAE